jgi:carboxylesterase type B
LVPVAFGPRIDSERDSPFLPDDPEVLVSRKQFNQVPMIVGLTKDEGSLFSASKNILFTVFIINIFKIIIIY